VKGRKPKPTALKIAQGNPGHRPLNASEPKPQTGAPKCPKHLSKEAKAVWRRVVPELDRLGLMTGIDLDAMVRYCQACALYDKAVSMIAVKGETQVTPQGIEIPSVWINIANKASENIRKLAAVFGLTPADRVRLSAKPPASPADELNEFLDNGKT
jgi:P27 family predicted phage terminase small subunit